MLAALSDAEVQRQSEIHRRYLQKVAAHERMRAQSRAQSRTAAKKATRRVFFPVGRRQPRGGGGSSGQDLPSRLLVSNLPFEERASRQRRTLIEAIDNCTTLAARRRFFEHAPPTVWVGRDRFGRSLGVGWISAQTRSEAVQIVALLNGTRMMGREIVARMDEPEPTTELPGGLLPQWRPLWLARTSSGEAPPVEEPEAAESASETSANTFTLDVSTLKWAPLNKESAEDEAASEGGEEEEEEVAADDGTGQRMPSAADGDDADERDNSGGASGAAGQAQKKSRKNKKSSTFIASPESYGKSW